MPKKNKPTILNIAYKNIPCVNTEINNGPYWFGRLCDNFDVKVDAETARVVCGTCVAHITAPGDPAEKQPTGYPQGWKLYREFVDSEGKVFHFGVEKPELFGTKEPTVIEKKVRKNKNKKEVNPNSLQVSKLKKILKDVKDPKERKEIINKIKLLEKGK
jgi:hypothetical protein